MENLHGFVAFIIFGIFSFIFSIKNGIKGYFGNPLNIDKSFGPGTNTKYVLSTTLLFSYKIFSSCSKLEENNLKFEKDCSLKKFPIKTIIKGKAISDLEYELTNNRIDLSTSLSAKFTFDKIKKN